MTSVSPDNFSTADTYVGRSAPWSAEAEQAVLGSMLLDQDAALRAAELVDDGMFWEAPAAFSGRCWPGRAPHRHRPHHAADGLIRRATRRRRRARYLAELIDAVPTISRFHGSCGTTPSCGG
jgi:hypothetical protein